MKVRRIHILLVLCGLTVVALMGRRFVRRCVVAGIQIVKGKKTVAQRVDEFGELVRQRLAADFQRAGVVYPPEKMAFIGLKQEKILEVWVADKSGEFVFLKNYPILGASGGPGPKLKEGDGQVPEGLYHIESLNPNSQFHLSLRVNYPNAFDKTMAAQEGRTHLGGDIMIHGSRSSVGCLAMGDPAAEDLFILAAETGVGNIAVLLAPVDFRVKDFDGSRRQLPDWTTELYPQIRTELQKFRQ